VDKDEAIRDLAERRLALEEILAASHRGERYTTPQLDNATTVLIGLLNQAEAALRAG
jgi:hypothetical protein